MMEFGSEFLITSLVIVIPVGFVIMSFVVMCREKMYLWFLEPLDSVESVSQTSVDPENPYHPQSAAADALPISPMSQRLGGELTSLNFTYVGAYRHAKRGIYQIRYDVMLSPDRLTLALIEVGTVMSMPVKNLSLITLGHRNEDGSPMACDSITNDACFDVPYAGMCETMLFNGATATKAVELHQKRMQLFEPTEYSDNPLNDYYLFRVQRQAMAVERGAIRLVEEGVALPTIKGVFQCFFATYGFQLGRRIFPHQWRLKRRLKRLSNA